MFDSVSENVSLRTEMNREWASAVEDDRDRWVSLGNVEHMENGRPIPPATFVGVPKKVIRQWGKDAIDARERVAFNVLIGSITGEVDEDANAYITAWADRVMGLVESALGTDDRILLKYAAKAQRWCRFLSSLDPLGDAMMELLLEETGYFDVELFDRQFQTAERNPNWRQEAIDRRQQAINDLRDKCRRQRERGN
jgi:hypothetical protein